MLEELFEHMDDCRGSARRHALPGAPGVDFLDQLDLDPDDDICGFPWHADEVGRCRAPLLDNSGQKIDMPVTVWPHGAETPAAPEDLSRSDGGASGAAGHRIGRTATIALDRLRISRSRRSVRPLLLLRRCRWRWRISCSAWRCAEPPLERMTERSELRITEQPSDLLE